MSREILFRKGFSKNTIIPTTTLGVVDPNTAAAVRANHWVKYHKVRNSILPISPRGNNK